MDARDVPISSDAKSVSSDAKHTTASSAPHKSKRFFFSQEATKHLNNITLQVLTKWNQTFRQPNYLDNNGDSIYQLVIVGGTALDIYLPPVEELLTFDLDLKLAYTKHIYVDEYFRLFQTRFNRIRTQIMLDLKWQINRSILGNPDMKRYFISNIKPVAGDYFQVAINYKYPFIVKSYDDALRCSKIHPEMTHMVMSLNYHPISLDMALSPHHQTLIDLSMFVNLNNPDRLFNLPLNNYLYAEGIRQNGKPLATHRLKFSSLSNEQVEIEVLRPGAILADLFWMSMLHHKPDKRLKFQGKINHLISGLFEQSIITEEIQTQLLTLISQNYLSLGYRLLDYFYLSIRKFFVTKLADTKDADTNASTDSSTLDLVKLSDITKAEEQLLENLTQLELLFSQLNRDGFSVTPQPNLQGRQFPFTTNK